MDDEARRSRGSSRMVLDTRPDGPCLTCAEGYEASGDERCPKAKRACNHHCNCLWTADVCHWCRAEPDGHGGLTIPLNASTRCQTVHQPPHVHNLHATQCSYLRHHEGRHSFEEDAS